MKKTWTLIPLILSLSLLYPLQVSTIQAQTVESSIYEDQGSSISWVINEPRNQTYHTATLNLNVTVKTLLASLTNVSYSLDNQAPVPLPMKEQETVNYPRTQGRNGVTLLSPLTNGEHKITIYVDGLAGFPSKPIPTQKTVVYFEIHTDAQIQDTSTRGNGVIIYSPCNRTYNLGEAIVINASSATLLGGNLIYEGTYTIDDKTSWPLTTEPVQTASWDPFFGALIATATMPPLPEGKHKLTVTLKTYIDSTAKPPALSGQATVYFVAGDIEPPNITLNMLNGIIFNQTCIPLNFNINEPTSSLTYCLDDGTQTAIGGNTTLTLTPGNHTLTVYANDTAGNMGQSITAHFTVQDNLALQTLLAAAVTLVAIFVAIVLVFFRRKNGHSGKRNASAASMNLSPAQLQSVQ